MAVRTRDFRVFDPQTERWFAMSYRSKKEALASIHERKRVRNGENYTIFEVFLGYDNVTRAQKRLSANTIVELKRRIADFYDSLASGGAAATTFTPYEATDARMALDLLSQHGRSISLVECVRRVLGTPDAVPAHSVTVQEAYTRFLAAQIGKTDIYIRGLRGRIGAFMDSFGPERPIGEVTAAGVTEYLKKRLVDKEDPKTWKTYNNHLGDLKTFFNWCTRSEQGYLARSPLGDVKKLVIAWKDPEYLRAEDVGKLFRTIALGSADRREDLADAVLSFFCGMRQDEIKRVREGKQAVNVDVANGFIRVVKAKGATKGVRPRAFTIPEPALSWMRAFDFDAAVMRPNDLFRRHLLSYAKDAGIELPANAGRHTFITMYAAAYHDQSKLTSIVGNTEGVRANSYDGVEIEANGRAYFAITPQSLGVNLG